MPPFGTNYNPMDVAMGRSASNGPYLWQGPGSAPPKPKSQLRLASGGAKSAVNGPVGGDGGSTAPTSSTPQMPSANSVLRPESIRATGTGPFDSAYRQNLATYAGGQFSRPGGSMNFNPTDPSTFPGQPVGGGTAPVIGMPQSLLDMALGGQGFSWTPPTQPAKTAQRPGQFGSLQEWMDQFMRGGRGQRMGSNL